MAGRKFRKYKVLGINFAEGTENEEIVRKVIYELSDEEIKECELLCMVRVGSAVQDPFTYALFLAMRECTNFDKLVYGYKQELSNKKEFTLKVSFYKKKD